MCYPIFESRGFSQGRGGSVKGKAKEEKSLTPGGGRVESGSSPLDFLLVSMRPRGTPVPIPNTMVKTRPAENTTLVTMWEDKWMPDFFKKRGSRNSILEKYGNCEEHIRLTTLVAAGRCESRLTN